MAQKVQLLLVDDLDGGEAGETVRFGLDGVTYEMDLSEKNATALREALAPYTGAARRLGRNAAKAARGRGGSGPATTDREQNRAIREWAKRKGLEVSERGRISQDVVKQYEAEAGR